MNIGAIFTLLFINPITNLLVACYKILIMLHIPSPLGFSIILLTVIIKLLLWPLVSAQIKSSFKMQKVAPHIASIREKHKDDKKRQQEEMMKLYKEHGVNPATGCLPMLIQIPIIWSLYSVLNHVVGTTAQTVGKVNDILYFPFLRIDSAAWNSPANLSFFGLPIAKSPSNLFSHMPLIILVPILTGVLQFILTKMMIPANAPKPTKDDFQSAMQTQTTYMIPAMIGFFSFSLPIGLSLYWNTLNVFGILQQYLLTGPGSLAPWTKKIGLNGKE